MDTATDSLARALADRYRLDAEIGRGGMATVYRAHDLRHDRPVALKVLHPELGAVLGVERFLAEIRVTANLQHPNLLPLFDSGEAAGLLFYVMPFVEGESLRARLDRERQLPVDESIRLIGGVLDGLALAHAQGIVHRDLKPENILLLHGQPVVADFGIALAVTKAGGQRITQTGLSLGTPQYMSPEQAAGDRAIDGRSDVYSAAAMLYEMLAGQPPHSGGTVQAIIAQVLTEKPRDVRSLRDTVPAHVAAALERALSKVPADRFAGAADFAKALREAGSAPVVSTPVARTARRARLWPLATALATVAAIASWVLRPTSTGPGVESLHLRRQLTFEGTVIGTAIAPDGQWLAYTSSPCGQRGPCRRSLNVREVDGTQSVRLLTWPALSAGVRWTPDGAAVLFQGISASPDSTGLFIVNRLGGSARRVWPDANAFAASPDGRELLVVSGAAGNQRLTRLDYPGLQQRTVMPLPNGWDVHDIAKHPSSDLLAVSFDDRTEGGIALLDSKGEVRSKWIGSIRPYVRWSADGASLFAITLSAGQADDLVRIRVRDSQILPEATIAIGQIPNGYQGVFDLGRTRGVVLRGSTLHEIPIRRLDSSDTSWRSVVRWTGYLVPSDFSKDGRQVLTTATDNLGDNVYAFDIETGAPQQVFSAPGVGRMSATWSDNGKRLLYKRVNTSLSEIVLTDALGGAERVVTKSIADPTWMSDSTILVAEPNALIVVDTAGRVRVRVGIPDSLGGQLASMAAGYAKAVDPKAQRVAYWSDRAKAIVALSLETKRFDVLVPSDVKLRPAAWDASGALIYFETRRSGETISARLMRRAMNANASTLVASVPAACKSVIVGAAGTRAACRIDNNSLDVWLFQ